MKIHPAGPKVFLLCFRNFTKRSFPLTIYRNLEWSGEKYREKGERIKAYIQSRTTRVRLRCLFNIFNHRRIYRTMGNSRWKSQNRISRYPMHNFCFNQCTYIYMLLLHLIYQQKAHLDRLLVEAVQALSMNREQQRDHYLKILFVHTRRHRSILKTTDRIKLEPADDRWFWLLSEFRVKSEWSQVARYCDSIAIEYRLKKAIND